MIRLEEQVVGAPRTPRSQLKPCGDRPVLVTAPHCIYVLRDGDTPHLVEESTAELAGMLANLLRGTHLMWSQLEQRRSELLVSCGRKQGIERSKILDPRNRDPNYLSTIEVTENPWFQQMQSAAQGWR